MGKLIPFRNRSFPEEVPIYSPDAYLFSEPESPETAIARQSPSIAADLLKDFSNKVLYRNLAESARGMLNTYLTCMREVEASALIESSEVEANVHKEFTKRSKLGTLLFGVQEIGFNISIKLK